MNQGIRPGTKPETRLGPKFSYVLSESPGYDEIRKVERNRQRYEEVIRVAIGKTRDSLLRMEIAHVLLHGGHVDKSLLAKSGLNVKMDPNKVIELCLKDLPLDLADKAVP